jgi:hypothetical protein
MFRNISWSSYGTFIAITLVAYYVTIGALYYLNEIKQIFSGKSSLLLNLNRSYKPVAKDQLELDNNLNKGLTQQSEDDLHRLANDCMNDIKNALQHAANHNLVRQEIIYSLQQLVKKYSSLRNTYFESFIRDCILTECQKHYSIRFDDDELRLIWAR